jgi:YggT family protein
VNALVAAITRNDVADYVDTLLTIYVLLIFIRIVMSWIPRMPYNRYLAAVLTFVTDVTDPYLRLFRRFIPPLKIGPAAIDLSPMIGIFVLLIVGGLVQNAIRS